jgi:hypothetical protein
MVQPEKVLKKLKVNKKLYIWRIGGSKESPRTLYIWVQKFGFATVPLWELNTFMEEHRSIEDFQGTILCYKVLFQLLLREKKKTTQFSSSLMFIEI